MKKSITSEPAPQTKQASRAALTKVSEKFDPDQSDYFVIPKLSGPKTDEGTDSRITSSSSWKPSSKGCAIPANGKQEVAKSVALEELLFRFTGDNSFTELHCAEACEDSGSIAYLNKLKIQSNRNSGSKFNFFMKKGGQCHYRISKATNKSWHMLKAKEVSCKCFGK